MVNNQQQQCRLGYLDAMGIEVWVERNKKQKIMENAVPVMKETVLNAKTALTGTGSKNFDGTVAPEWQNLQCEVSTCALCSLGKTRTNAVFGVGSPNAKVMFVGEAPGANEDLQGEPFVGRGGMLLNAMLQSIGLERNEVYIANVLKCRPPNNRDPSVQEVAACTPYLQRQIAFIRPQVIIAVGRVAAQFLLGSAESMARLRGRQYSYGEFHTPLFVIYHPAYLLRSPSEKRKAYDDLLKIKAWLMERSGAVLASV